MLVKKTVSSRILLLSGRELTVRTVISYSKGFQFFRKVALFDTADVMLFSSTKLKMTQQHFNSYCAGACSRMLEET